MLDHFAGKDGVGILRNIADAVRHAVVVRNVGKLIHIASALEAEMLEDRIRRVLCQDRDIELPCLHDHITGVVLFDDRDRDLLRIAGRDLAGGVDDAAVVLAIDACGQHLDTVAELVEDLFIHRVRGERADISGGSGLNRRWAELGGKRVGQRVEVGKLSLRKRGFERDVLADKLGVLQSGEDLTHDLAAHGRPAAVFDQSDLAVLEVVRRNIVQQVFHRHKHARVIGRGRKDKMAAAECVGDDIARWDDRGVVHADAHSPLRKLGGKDVGSVLRMAVDGSIGDQDALFLGSIAAPQHIFLEEIAEVAAPDEAVQRADVLDIKPGRLFQHALHLRAVLADDVGIVPSGLIKVLGKEIGLVGKEPAVERAEKPERIGRKKNAVCAVIGHHNLGPVNHGSVDKVQDVAAGGKAVALLDKHDAIRQILREELAEHGFDLRVADDLNSGITDDEIADRISVIRLHVRNDQIIQLPPAERELDIFKKSLIDRFVHGVEQYGLLIEHEI